MKMDPSLKFYFAHQKQIEEWTSLSRLIPEEVLKFMKEVASSLEKESVGWTGPPDVVVFLDQNYPEILLQKRSWVYSKPNDAHATICIASSSAKPLYHSLKTGVTAEPEGPIYKKLHPRLKEELARVPGSENGSADKWWARYWEEPVPEEFWDHLDEFKDALVKRMFDHWVRFAPIIDKVLGEI
ncbi:MAG: hypothetical protein WC931_03660 [Bacilli bacterium]|jgi:hypothetical protein